MDNMTKKEKRFVARLLNIASDTFSNHRCNDLPKDLETYFTKEELAKLNLKLNQWNEGTDTPKEDAHLEHYDWLAMSYFAHVLEEEGKE